MAYRRFTVPTPYRLGRNLCDSNPGCWIARFSVPNGHSKFKVAHYQDLKRKSICIPSHPTGPPRWIFQPVGTKQQRVKYKRKPPGLYFEAAPAGDNASKWT